MRYILFVDAVKKVPVEFINKWMYVSIIELLIIIMLGIVLLKKKQNKPEEIHVGEDVKAYKDAEVDLGNFFNSMFNAESLYDTLKRHIHEDRFPNDPEKKVLAAELAMRMNEKQNDIGELNKIKAIAIEKLGLKL